MQPCSTVPDDSSKPWFAVNPIGKNSLCKMVKEVCSERGISGRKINHSLRATGAIDLYQAGFPENLIQERTGPCRLVGFVTMSALKSVSRRRCPESSQLQMAQLTRNSCHCRQFRVFLYYFLYHLLYSFLCWCRK